MVKAWRRITKQLSQREARRDKRLNDPNAELASRHANTPYLWKNHFNTYSLVAYCFIEADVINSKILYHRCHLSSVESLPALFERDVRPHNVVTTHSYLPSLQQVLGLEMDGH